VKIISSLRDLEPFGVVPVAGESCILDYRVVCDLTAKGKVVVEKLLGLPMGTRFAEPRNAGAAGAPHVGSVIVAPELFIPLAVFACLENGCVEAYRMDEFVVGIEPGDAPDAAVRVELTHRVQRVRRFHYQGTACDQNLHQASGHIE
jgi:hypothetical protein